MAQLIITSDSGETSLHHLTEDIVTIGRRKDNSLCLSHLSISGHHARISRENGCLVLEDLQSTNGTLVNGVPISRHVLSHHDQITLGMFELQYTEPASEAMPAPPAVAQAEKADVIDLPDPAAGQRIDPDLSGAMDDYQPGATTAEPAVPTAVAAQQHIELEQDTRAIVSELAALRVESGPKTGDIFVLEKSVTTLGKRGDQAGAIARKDSGYYFVPLCLDAGQGRIKINGAGLNPKSEIKLATGDNLELAGAKIEFIYPFYGSA
jgi:hypothetical protein